MRVIESVVEMQQWALCEKRTGRRIGLVPTMGYLHEGHLSLVTLARDRADVVVVSIFVNPIQFLPGEDLACYPRDFERDCALCKEAGVDLVFHPKPGSIYTVDHSVFVDEIRLSSLLCGVSRPGHFKGVTTVVAKLFNITQPDVAVFGQKDAQQCRIIQRMVRDLNFPVDVFLGPIVREPDGLAMSSRNKYLTAHERQEALCLRQALRSAESMVRSGERRVAILQAALEAGIGAVASAKLEYAEFVDNETLETVSLIDRPVLLALAVRVGATRLIDNTVLC